MNLKNLPFPVYGDTAFRGPCLVEDLEQITFFNHLRTQYPKTYGLIAIHPKNEGLAYGGQFRRVAKDKAKGQSKGAADIIIPCGPMPFVCELKRRDHTKSTWQSGQIEYLTACYELGAFVCVGLGYAGAWEGFLDWHSINRPALSAP